MITFGTLKVISNYSEPKNSKNIFYMLKGLQIALFFSP